MQLKDLGKPIDPDERIDYVQYRNEQLEKERQAGRSYHWLQRRSNSMEWVTAIRETAWQMGWSLEKENMRPRWQWAMIWQTALLHSS
jgi:hypothetical protein